MAWADIKTCKKKKKRLRVIKFLPKKRISSHFIFEEEYLLY